MTARFGRSNPVRVLVDTNVWLDYFLARSERHEDVTCFVTGAADREDIVLYVASLTLKDLAYQLASQMKLDARRAGAEVTEAVAAAAREVSWSCVRNVLELAVVAPVGSNEVLGAFTLRHVHDDLEDDMILAVAEAVGAHALMTHDAQLARHAESLCITARDGVELLSEFDGQK